MIKHLIWLILAVFLFTAPNLAHAQEEQISLLDNTVEIYFPSALVFKIEAASQSDIAKIRLHYQVDKMNYAQVTSEVWLDFTPSPEVEAEWVCDMRKVSLPAGAKVEYWWTIETEAGDTLVTYSDIIQFDDLRYSWQELTEGQLSLFWYEGSQSFAEKLMTACQQALERLAEDTGAYLEKPVSIYIYASTRDLQGAMIFPQEWTGGVAFTEHSIIAIGVPPGELDWGKRALAHELGHMVTHQITFSPYGAFLPVWLDEGLAMHAEGEPDPHLQSWLEKAISKQKLISVRSLASPFSAKPEEAYTSYAESQSLVEFLIQNYGKDNMLNLLSLLKEGNSCDDALTKVYGFDQDGLDKLWREYITGQAHSQPVFEYASLQKVNAESTLWEDVLAKSARANMLSGCID
jgi:hypothetical protein